MHGSKFIIKALNKQNSKLVVCGYSIIIRRLHVSPCADFKGVVDGVLKQHIPFKNSNFLNSHSKHRYPSDPHLKNFMDPGM